jgi:hypothetical protein
MLLVFALLPVPPAWARDPGRMQPMARAAILFAADGLRQDLVEEFVAEGALRTFGRLLEDMPAIDARTRGGSTPRRMATTSSITGSTGWSAISCARRSRSWR